MSSDPNQASFDNDYVSVVFSAIKSTITEINMLIPDSILFGSLLMYFLTQNMAFGIFGVFIFETVLSHKLISWVSSQSVGPSRSVDIKCRSGFKTPQFSPQRMFSHDSYPSYSVFSITAIGTYLGLATNEFKSTLNAMGAEWSSRATLAYSFIGAMIAIFIGLRLFKCDSVGEVVLAVLLAIVTGSIFFSLNKAVFGQEAMNFLGLPYMVSKDSQGSPIYICAAEKDDSKSA
jgi:hypothetical protein